MTVDTNQEGCPNYYPNSFGGPRDDIKKYSESKFTVNHADVGRFNSSDEDNFTQCGIFFNKTLNQEERERLVDNIASHVINAQEFLQVISKYISILAISSKRGTYFVRNHPFKTSANFHNF